MLPAQRPKSPHGVIGIVTALNGSGEEEHAGWIDHPAGMEG